MHLIGARVNVFWRKCKWSKSGEKMTNLRITRREMLRVVMLGGTGLIAAACSAPQAPAATTAAPAATQVPEAPAATAAPEATKASDPTAVPEATQAPVAPASGKEAPALAELVKQGKLPALDKRLPPDPMVITPIEEVGTYGGKLSWIIEGPQFGSYEYQFLYEGPYRWSADAVKLSRTLR